MIPQIRTLSCGSCPFPCPPEAWDSVPYTEFVPGERIEVAATKQRGVIAGANDKYVVHMDEGEPMFVWFSMSELSHLPESEEYRRVWKADLESMREESRQFWRQENIPLCPCRRYWSTHA